MRILILLAAIVAVASLHRWCCSLCEAVVQIQDASGDLRECSVDVVKVIRVIVVVVGSRRCGNSSCVSVWRVLLLFLAGSGGCFSLLLLYTIV